MHSEIEAKLKVESLQQIEQRLNAINANFLEEQEQCDLYFDDNNSSLKNSDKCLRIRKQSVDKKHRFFLTFKGAKEKDNFKKRQEVEFEITDFDSACRLLELLEYKKALEVKKKRKVYTLENCTIALDELPMLGSFVEIEGPDDKIISSIQSKLGLGNLEHIPESYADLICKK